MIFDIISILFVLAISEISCNWVLSMDYEILITNLSHF